MEKARGTFSRLLSPPLACFFLWVVWVVPLQHPPPHSPEAVTWEFRETGCMANMSLAELSRRLRNSNKMIQTLKTYPWSTTNREEKQTGRSEAGRLFTQLPKATEVLNM